MGKNAQSFSQLRKDGSDKLKEFMDKRTPSDAGGAR